MWMPILAYARVSDKADWTLVFTAAPVCIPVWSFSEKFALAQTYSGQDARNSGRFKTVAGASIRYSFRAWMRRRATEELCAMPGASSSSSPWQCTSVTGANSLIGSGQ